MPDFYAKALASHRGDPSGSVIPDWPPEHAIAFMTSQQIATEILPVTRRGW